MIPKEYPFPKFSDAEKSKVQEILVKSPELASLLLPFRDESGHFVRNSNLLFKKEGKRILEIVLNELRLEWRDIFLILELRQSAIGKAAAFHKVKKWKMPQSRFWEERLSLVQEFYEKSHSLRAKNELRALWQEMVAAVNAKCDAPVSADAIRQKARIFPWGIWGHSLASGTIEAKEGNSPLPELVARRQEREDFLKNTQGISMNNVSAPKKLKPDVQEGACVALMSRIDFGGGGYRRGLIRLGCQACQQKGADFAIIVSGLVDKRALYEEWNLHFQSIKASQAWKDVPKDERGAEKAAEFQYFCKEKALALAKAFPQIKKSDGSVVRIYIITSNAYDGDVGAMIARHLAEIRSDDFVFWSHGTPVDRPLLVKFVNKHILPIVPQKASWRSRYYATSPQREIQDVEKRSARPLPDVLVVGGFAASIGKPRGEAKRAWLTVPALHNILETHSSENQVGIRFLHFRPDGSFTTSTRSFKGLLTDERELIKAPEGLSELQNKLFSLIKTGPMRLGMLEYHLGAEVDRLTIQKEMGLLMTKSAITFDEGSDTYDFSQEVFQQDIEYPLIDTTVACREDIIIGFGCLHAASPTTDYKFFMKELPSFIVSRRATLLVGAGDLTQGLSHEMLERGEVFAGINDTKQELFAAHLVGEVIVRVFRLRMQTEIASLTQETTPEQTLAFVKKELIPFLWVPGNHDDWKKRKGIAPLVVFENALKDYIAHGIRTILAEKKIAFTDGILEAIKERVIKDDTSRTIRYKSPLSGLNIKTTHPGTARAETVSIMAERLLAQHRDAHVIIPANWHVAAEVEHFDQDLGQRLVLQCPTICTHTIFEDGKMKTTDFGVGFAAVRSKKGKIIEMETGFFGTPLLKVDHDNLDLLNLFLTKELGCLPIEMSR